MYFVPNAVLNVLRFRSALTEAPASAPSTLNRISPTNASGVLSSDPQLDSSVADAVGNPDGLKPVLKRSKFVGRVSIYRPPDLVTGDTKKLKNGVRFGPNVRVKVVDSNTNGAPLCSVRVGHDLREYCQVQYDPETLTPLIDNYIIKEVLTRRHFLLALY